MTGKAIFLDTPSTAPVIGVITRWSYIKEANHAIAVCEVIPAVLILTWPRTFAKSRAANGKMRSLPTEALNTNTKCLTDLGRAWMSTFELIFCIACVQIPDVFLVDIWHCRVMNGCCTKPRVRCMGGTISCS